MPAIKTLDDVGALLKRDSVFCSALDKLNKKRVRNATEVVRSVYPQLLEAPSGAAKDSLLRKYDKAMRALIGEMDSCRLSYAAMRAGSAFMMQVRFETHTEFKRAESLVVLPYGISAKEVDSAAKIFDKVKAKVLAAVSLPGSGSTARAVNPDLLFSAFVGAGGVGCASAIAAGASNLALLAEAKELAWWQIALAVLSLLLMAGALIAGA
jgi:hypothetical protein